MSDPDLGGWRYGYNRQGNLIRQTDARGKTICLYYDGLARLVGKHFRSDATCPASLTSYDVAYNYDQGHTDSNRSRGQRCCFFRNPACPRCPVLDLHPYGQRLLTPPTAQTSKPTPA